MQIKKGDKRRTDWERIQLKGKNYIKEIELNLNIHT